MSNEITVTIPRDQYYEICNVLQLMTVLGIKLYAIGPQPNIQLLSAAFNAFIKASMPKSNTKLE